MQQRVAFPKKNNGEEAFEAYAKNKTGPNKNEITILAITPHP